jgi:serine/threonine protein kinase
MQTSGLSMADFQILYVLGRGSYGKVQLCKRLNSGELVAIKTVHKSKLVASRKIHTVFNERNILMKSRHPFIVDFAFTFQSETKVYLGLEYVAGGDLFGHLQKRHQIPLPEVRLYIAELALAINYLHVLGVVYRDLKSENVLLDLEGHVKLTDFGLSKELNSDDQTTASFCGTSEYLPPELLSGRRYSFSVDWWMLGILTYELINGRSPFYDPARDRMYLAIRFDPPKYPPAWDDPTVNFISMLLEKDPTARGDFEKIRYHPFFDGLDFAKVLAREIKPAFIPAAPPGQPAANFWTYANKDIPVDSLGTPAACPSGAFDGFSATGHDGHQSSSDGEADPAPLEPTPFGE